MSGLLLDTNILIAFVNKTVGALPGRIRRALTDNPPNLAVSVVSPWEIGIKSASGKLALEEPIETLAGLIASWGFTLLPMTIDHAIEVAYPEPATKDPFDRLLLAVCACEGRKLLTTDARLAGHRMVW